MNWPKIEAANRKPHEAGDLPTAEAWQEFTSTVLRSANSQPYHLVILLNAIEHYRGLQEPNSSF